MAFLDTLLLIVVCLLVLIQLYPDTASQWGLVLERKRSGLVLKSQAITGFDIPYLEGGQGEVLVLVHGFGGDKDVCKVNRFARWLMFELHRQRAGDATRRILLEGFGQGCCECVFQRSWTPVSA